MQKIDFNLSPEIEGKFEVHNTHCPIFNWQGKKYDLRTISLADAEKLNAFDDTFLKRVEPGIIPDAPAKEKRSNIKK